MLKFVLLDGNALLHRAYHAVAPLSTEDGTPVNALYGFASMVFSILSEDRPDYFAVAFDTAARTFRKEKCETYKAGRVKPQDDFYAQIPLVHEFLDTMHILRLGVDGYEADDILATFAKHLSEKHPEFHLTLVTSDRDAFQLISERCSVHTLGGGYRQGKVYTPEAVYAEFGVTPTQFVDYKALIGDNSDNLPGVKGIGPKTASALLQKYQTFGNIYEHLPELKSGERDKLVAGQETGAFTREMAQLDPDVPFDFHCETYSSAHFTPGASELFLKRYTPALISRLHRYMAGGPVEEGGHSHRVSIAPSVPVVSEQLSLF